MDQNESTWTWRTLLTSYPARLAGYGIVTAMMFEAVYALRQSHGPAWLAAENGPIEIAQVLLLLFSAAGIALALRWTPFGRAVLVATGGVAIYAAARESDQWFESLFFDDAYKWLVGVPVAILILAVAALERRKLIAETLRMSVRPGSTLFTMAGIFLCFFCQILDRPLWWDANELDAAAGAQKMLIEESAELFAYLLIAFSGIEAAVFAWQDRAALTQRDSESTQPGQHDSEAAEGMRIGQHRSSRPNDSSRTAA